MLLFSLTFSHSRDNFQSARVKGLGRFKVVMDIVCYAGRGEGKAKSPAVTEEGGMLSAGALSHHRAQIPLPYRMVRYTVWQRVQKGVEGIASRPAPKPRSSVNRTTGDTAVSAKESTR